MCLHAWKMNIYVYICVCTNIYIYHLCRLAYLLSYISENLRYYIPRFIRFSACQGKGCWISQTESLLQPVGLILRKITNQYGSIKTNKLVSSARVYAKSRTQAAWEPAICFVSRDGGLLLCAGRSRRHSACYMRSRSDASDIEVFRVWY